MSIRGKQIFWIVSIVLLLADTTLVWFNYRESHHSMVANMEEDSRRFRASYEMINDQVCRQMLQLSHYIANDAKVRQLFYEGKKAVEAEGGGSGGEQAAIARKALYDEVSESWKTLQDVSDYRQLHFHMGPGSTSFLRVHAPHKFGDNMDDLRHTIVYANQEQGETCGFETGRVISGIRGVVPIGYKDSYSGELTKVGAIETGTSFRIIMDNLLKRFDREISVFLTTDHLRNCLWSEYFEQHLEGDSTIGDFVIEETSSPEFNEILSPEELKVFYDGESVRLKSVGGIWYSVMGLPLRDFLGSRLQERKNIGVISSWKDVSDAVKEFRVTQFKIGGIALFSFIIVELLLLVSIGAATKGLEGLVNKSRADLIEKNRELRDANQQISEQNKKLKENSQEKNEFIGIATHDLKNPLAAIVGTIDFLQYDPTLSEGKKDQLVDGMKQGCNQMIAIIDGLLNIVRFDQGRFKPENQKINLHDFIRSELDMFNQQAESKGLSIVAELEKGVEVTTDPTSLREVFQNLLSNAIKFSSEGKNIQVKCGRKGEVCHFSIKDEGPGFTEDDKTKLFKRFAKLSARPTGKESSSGLGLAIVRRFVNVMAAEIRLNSEAGHGAEFIVTIPLRKPRK